MENFIKEQRQRIDEARKSAVYKKNKAFRELTEKSAVSLEHLANEMLKCE
jgi:hypothetical protein